MNEVAVTSIEAQMLDVITLVSMLGLNVEIHSNAVPIDGSSSPSFWDGRRFHVTWDLTIPSDFVHEVAHWILAPKSRRAIRDFGLGPPPFYESSSPLIVSTEYAENEESMASILGIAMERAMGWLNWKDTWFRHGWGGDNGAYARKIRDRIGSEGIQRIMGVCRTVQVWGRWRKSR